MKKGLYKRLFLSFLLLLFIFAAIALYLIDGIENGFIIGSFFLFAYLFIAYKYYMEFKLKLSENRFKTLFEDNSTAMVLFDINDETLVIKDMNRAVCSLFGRDCRGILGEDASMLFGDETEAIRRSIMLGESRVAFIKRDGRNSGKYIEIHSTKIIGKGGVQAVCTMLDESGRFYFQERLKESEKRLKELSNLSEEDIFLIKNGRILDVNDAGIRLFGYPKEYIIGKSPLDFVKNEYRELLLKELAKTSGSYNTRAIDSQGREIPLYVKFKNVSIDNEEYRVSLVRDLSDVFILEEELGEKSDFIKAVFANTPISLFYKDVDGIYRYCNNRFAKLLGASSVDDIIGKSVFDFLPREEAIFVCNKDSELILSGESTQVYETMINIKGQEIFAHYYKELFKNQQGEILGIIGAIIDLTERKELENNLRTFNEYLSLQVESEVAERLKIKREIDAKEKLLIQQSKMAEIGNMVAAIAHQWKQPLNVIAILAQNLGDAYEYNELSKEKMDNFQKDLRKQIKFMSGTMDDFRNFFKPSKEKRRFDLKKSIEEIYALISVQFVGKKIETDIRGDEVSVFGYPNEFKQVALNILNNARETIIEKSIPFGRIDIEVGVEGGFGVCIFSDNGGGIPAELLPDKLFLPYVSTKGEQGTGIGLSMTKSIMEDSMNGSIEARNIEGGAQFILKLPLYKEDV